MLLPIQVSFRDTLASKAIEANIRKKAEKLEQYFNRISSCRIVVKSTQKHKHQKLYTIRIDVTVPGKEFAVTHKKNEDVYIAIRDAFNAIARQLENHARKQRQDVKTHEETLHGHVARIMPHDGYGFIEGIDGNEYYFSTTNVGHPDFDDLGVGDLVEYTSAIFGDGRHAHHVIRGRRNHNHQ